MSEPPRTVESMADQVPECPWCGEYMDEAKVSLIDVTSAVILIAGHAGLALDCECPSCGKPSQLMARIGGNGPEFMEMIGQRTPADERFLAAQTGDRP